MGAVSNYCQVIQRNLDDLVGKGAIPSQLRTRDGVGIIDALRSKINLDGIEQVQSSFGTSKDKILKMRYIQRASAAVGTSPVDPCAAQTTKDFREEDFIVDRFVTKGCSFDMLDWTKYCEEGNDVVAKQIAQLFDPILQHVSKDISNILSSKVLRDASATDTNVTPIPLTMFQDVATRTVNIAGQDDLINSFSDIQASLQPIVVGQGLMRAYANTSDFGCCNQFGQDIDAVMANSPFLWFNDRNVGTQLVAPNDVYAWEPGKLQLPIWNRYNDEQQYEKTTTLNGRPYVYEANTQITDPITGIAFDAQIREDNCGQYNKITLNLSLNYGLWCIPADAFPTGDPLEGVKYVLRYTVS